MGCRSTGATPHVLALAAALSLSFALAACGAPAASAAKPRFVRGLSIALPGAPGKVLATELSGDHHPDVLVAAGDLVALRNTGDGGLVPSPTLAKPKNAYGSPGGYRELAAGDLDGDGDADYVALTEVKTPSRVIGTNRDGTPATLDFGWMARTLLGSPQGPRPGPMLTGLPIDLNSPLLADLDGDGRLDLVFTATSDARFANGGGVSLFVAHGRGDGSFDAAEILVDDFPGGEPAIGGAGIVAGDFDGDGTTDLAAQVAKGVEILPSIGRPAPGAPSVVATCGTQFAVADLDGDGHPDLAASCFYEDAASVLLAQAPFGAQAAPFSFRPTARRPAGIQPAAPLVADVTADGHLDVLTVGLAPDEHSGFVRVLRGDGHGNLDKGFDVPVNYPISAATADLNGDGRRDVVAADVGRNLLVTAFNDPRRLPANVALARPPARVSIHTAKLHVAPGDRIARVTVACSRGRGQCHGRLDLRGTGRRERRLLGRQAFELAPGTRRRVAVFVTDDRFAALRVRAVASSTYNRAARPLTLTGPSRYERGAACRPPHTITLAEGPRMRVYAERYADEPIACLPRVGHPHDIAFGTGARGPFAIARDLVAFRAQDCGDANLPCSLDVHVVNVATGKIVRQTLSDDVPYGADAVADLVLRRDGVAAWIACDSIDMVANRCRRRGLRSVVTFDGGAGDYQPRRLARGRIRSGSLRLSPSGRRVSWLDGSTRRSARLTTPPRPRPG